MSGPAVAPPHGANFDRTWRVIREMTTVDGLQHNARAITERLAAAGLITPDDEQPLAERFGEAMGDPPKATP